MTPKEKEALLKKQIEDLHAKLDKVLELLGDKNGKAKKPAKSK